MPVTELFKVYNNIVPSIFNEIFHKRKFETSNYSSFLLQLEQQNLKLYVPVVTLSTPNNRKLLQQLKSGFKRTTNWN